MVGTCTAVESGSLELVVDFEGIEYTGTDSDFVDDDVFDLELFGGGDDSSGG